MSTPYADLVETFQDAGLPVPPIPEALRSELRYLEQWCWATRPVDPMDMYMFHRYPVEAVAAAVADYAAISHAGHGINSYAINYHLVHGPLAVFIQELWGGVYEDDTKQAASLARLFSECHRLLAAAPDAWDRTSTRRLLILVSPFRSLRLCSWIDASRPPHDAMAWISSQSSHPDPLAQALVELTSRSGDACA